MRLLRRMRSSQFHRCLFFTTWWVLRNRADPSSDGNKILPPISPTTLKKIIYQITPFLILHIHSFTKRFAHNGAPYSGTRFDFWGIVFTITFSLQKLRQNQKGVVGKSQRKNRGQENQSKIVLVTRLISAPNPVYSKLGAYDVPALVFSNKLKVITAWFSCVAVLQKASLRKLVPDKPDDLPV